MGRKQNFEMLYKISLMLLKSNKVDITNFSAGEIARKTGCSKTYVYSYMNQVERDINVL